MNLASMCNKMKEEDLRWHSTMTPWVNRWRDVLPPVASLLHFLLTLGDLPSILPTLLVLSFYVSILFLPFHSYPSLAHRRCCCCFSTAPFRVTNVPGHASDGIIQLRNCTLASWGGSRRWLGYSICIGVVVWSFMFCWTCRFILGGHSMTTWTRRGGRWSKNLYFSPRSGLEISR